MMHDCVAKRQPTTGQGELLTLLMAAWWYAKKTGRRLVIDWRGMWWARGKNGRNTFTEFFKNRDEIAGVPIVLCGVNHKHEYVDAIPLRFGRGEGVCAVADGVDCKYDAVVFNHGQSIMAVPPAVADRREFMQALEPCDAVLEEVAKYDHHFNQAHPVVGVHFRHGNGEDIGKNRRELWPLNQNIVAHDFAREVAALGFKNHTTLICTDYVPAREAMLKVLPGAFFYDKWLPPIGEGVVHSFHPTFEPDGHVIGVEALAEYIVLSKCDAMVYTDSLMTIHTRYIANFKKMKRIYASGGCPFDLDLTIERMHMMRRRYPRREKVA